MEWNVYVGNFNSKTIEVHNVFDHLRFVRDLTKELKKIEKSDASEEKKKDDFAEAMRKELMYYYWSKCEWEVIVSHWPHGKDDRDEKIDVYDQVCLNWDKFVDYVWANRKDLKALARKNERTYGK